MAVKQEVVVAAIKFNFGACFVFCIGMLCSTGILSAQETDGAYKKRVLENSEVDLLMGYYQQDGENAAVSGGIGNEELTDVVPTIVVSVPLNADDILKVDASISAYTSASSSNINPFDSKETADPYIASTGASGGDIWFNTTVTYSHSSDDRNTLWSGSFSTSNEFDYSSIGVGGSFTKLFNEKNTEFSIHSKYYFDTWRAIYPYELRQFDGGGPAFMVQNNNGTYTSNFKQFQDEGRTTLLVGASFSQILSKRAQVAFMYDYTQQEGLLSTPFQRVYFQDKADFFLDDFQLADDVERLPNQRSKHALGGRLNYYVNEHLVIRSFYRYYFDDWGILAHTLQFDFPIKIGLNYTLYPSYRYYVQTAADYFAPYEGHLSTASFYTSDYDLSDYQANQFGLGIKYTDPLLQKNISVFKLKTLFFKTHLYKRVGGLEAMLFTVGTSLVLDP
ncbi:MAG: DUF3570 domain-containing protein [Vicingaceae bacterium]